MGYQMCWISFLRIGLPALATQGKVKPLFNSGIPLVGMRDISCLGMDDRKVVASSVMDIDKEKWSDLQMSKLREDRRSNGKRHHPIRPT